MKTSLFKCILATMFCVSSAFAMEQTNLAEQTLVENFGKDNAFQDTHQDDAGKEIYNQSQEVSKKIISLLNKNGINSLIDKKDLPEHSFSHAIWGDKDTLLVWATCHGLENVVDLLLQHPQIDLSINNQGKRALKEAEKRGFVNIVKMLLKKLNIHGQEAKIIKNHAIIIDQKNHPFGHSSIGKGVDSCCKIFVGTTAAMLIFVTLLISMVAAGSSH